jgi:succinate dehydrogenase / fumarate reductase cytochrome b subunit
MEAKPLFKSLFSTTIGQKIVMALSGLFLVVFVIVHLMGNLSLLVSSEAFNTYTHKLESLGPLLYVVELILLAGFVFHFGLAIIVTLKNWKARGDKYKTLKSAGDPSKQTFSSKTMIYTGAIILIFTIIHVKTFKYGPYYETTIAGEQVRDLYRLVIEVFQNLKYVVGYTAVMILLGFHVRHGFWSAFQSLGANHPRYSALIYTVGILIAFILSIGFLLIPILIYINGGVL